MVFAISVTTIAKHAMVVTKITVTHAKDSIINGHKPQIIVKRHAPGEYTLATLEIG